MLKPLNKEKAETTVELFTQSFIALCRIIRKTDIEDEAGPVWRTRKDSSGQPVPAGFFLLGLGDSNILPPRLIYFYISDQHWDSCYFAKELPQAPETDWRPSPKEFAEMLSTLVE